MLLRTLSVALVLGALSPSALAEEGSYAPPAAEAESYVFGWVGLEGEHATLRGGTSKGIPVTLRTEPTEAWTALQEEGLSAQERDRRAILAMAGDHRASFDFLEVETYGEQRLPAAPYRSWATERIKVLADEGDFVSLQHILVMFVETPEGVEGPMVVKHWRQDWQYEPSSLLDYQGLGHFEFAAVSPDAAAGKWSQTVYQVDDSPRYAMIGAWDHTASASTWSSEEAWRPLPRREYTVRDDYQALVGTHRITIMPTSWLHTQDALKTVATAPGTVDPALPALARELALDRYDRIEGFDFAAGETYLADTALYWAAVREGWAEVIDAGQPFDVSTSCEGEKAFAVFFGGAEAAAGKPKLKAKHADRIRETIACMTAPNPASPL